MTAPASVDVHATESLDGVVLRLVEQQGSQATRRITDSLTEQAWLEGFLEQSKPDLPDPQECPLRHPLLLTPFRYRKRHGSRFGARWERGLFYGSRNRFGCLLEGAYYELLFQSGPEQPFPRAAAMRKRPCSNVCVIPSTRSSARRWGDRCGRRASKPSNTTRRVAAKLSCMWG